MNFTLCGIRGSFEGYEDAIVWREPLIDDGDGRCLFPTARYWTATTLAEITSLQEPAFTRIEVSRTSLHPADLVIVVGSVIRKRVEKAGLDLGLYGNWLEMGGGFSLLAGSLSLYRKLVSDVSIRMQSAFWRAVSEGQFADAESSIRVLGQNESIDRRRYYVLAALHAVLEEDPGRVDSVTRMAAAELGIASRDLFDRADEVWRQFRKMSGDREQVGHLDIVVQRKADELWPTVRLSDLTHSTLAHHAEIISEAFDQGRRQGVKVRLDISGMDSAQRPWLPPLVMIAHSLSHGSSDVELETYSGTRPVESRGDLPPSVAASLGRSGVLRAIRRRSELNERAQTLDRGRWSAKIAPTYRIERRESEELIVAELHASVDVVFSREVVERLLPTWIQSAFPTAVDHFFVHATKVASELAKNVREHAGLRRSPTSESVLHLSKTRGGANSTDRLWIVVSDNGIGMRGSLEARAGGPLPMATGDALRELVTPASFEAQFGSEAGSIGDIRKLTGAGDGLSDLMVLCRELEHATRYPAQIFYMSTSKVDDGYETTIAQVRPETGQATVDVVATAYGAAGTVAIVQLPTGSGAVRAERRGELAEAGMLALDLQ